MGVPVATTVNTATREQIAPTHDSPPTVPTRFLRELGIIGVDRLDAVILAALATKAPILLIGAHGTAKSLLLARLAEALGLSFRHYNASLLNYDDLVGYPLPDPSGSLRFVQTPASVWGAQAVFLDEISRCRPEMQNKCFPIIHEKCIQGIPLAGLEYRWAAMNPPPTESSAGSDASEYLGSESLDIALADRFPFVVEMPHWRDFSEADRLALVGLNITEISPEAKLAIAAMVKLVRERLLFVEGAFKAWVCEYVQLIALELVAMGLHLSARRAVMLRDAVLSMHAARWTLSAQFKMDESAWIALKHTIPDRAWGAVVDEGRMQLAHRRVCGLVAMDRADPRRLLAQAADPVSRAFLALEVESLAAHERSAYVADALASCGLGARHLVAIAISHHPSVAHFHPAIAEQVGVLVGEAEMSCSVSVQSQKGSSQELAFAEILKATSGASEPREVMVPLQNLLLRLWSEGKCSSMQALGQIVADYKSMFARLQARASHA